MLISGLLLGGAIGSVWTLAIMEWAQVLRGCF